VNTRRKRKGDLAERRGISFSGEKKSSKTIGMPSRHEGRIRRISREGKRGGGLQLKWFAAKKAEDNPTMPGKGKHLKGGGGGLIHREKGKNGRPGTIFFETFKGERCQTLGRTHVRYERLEGRRR